VLGFGIVTVVAFSHIVGALVPGIKLNLCRKHECCVHVLLKFMYGSV
jgi:hypothetical protein